MGIISKIIMSVLLIIILSACGGERYDSQRVQQPIIVDGSTLDWNNIPLIFLEDQAMVMGFANSDSVFYAMYRFSDEILARKIHTRGVVLWFDPDDSKNKTFGIRYHRFYAGSPPEHRMGGETDNQPIIMDGKFMVVQGDMKLSTGMEYFPGLAAAAGQEKSLYAFEFAVPYKYLAADHSISGDKIGLGIEIGALTAEERSGMRKDMGDRDDEQPQRGMHGGGHRSGMWGGEGGRPDMNSEEIWITVSLAK
jgi:hypothetical protein